MTRTHWKVRQACHRQWWRCCQYCDTSQCNGAHDPHFVGLMLWKRDQREPSRLRRLLRAIKDHLEGIGADLNRRDKP